MKPWKKWGLAGLLLTVLAAIGLADNNVLDHSTYFQNATNGAKTDASGNAYVTESTPAMDANLTFASIISNTSLAAGVADSSSVMDTHRMRLGMLLIKCTPLSLTGADSLGITRIGVQIRTHLNGISDSSSTFACYMYGRSDQGGVAAASQIDTSAAGQIFNAVNLAASANSAHSGEFVVFVANDRVGPGTSAIGTMGQRTYSWPNGIAIPLQSIFGRDLYSPYTSIRVRNLGNTGPANRSVSITVHLIGTPL
jgi:hypothetical protein